MVLTVPVNTYEALVSAHVNGIVPRDFVWIKALNRDTDEIESIGLWSGNVPVEVAVIKPSDGSTTTRVYQGIAGLMSVPAVPMSMKLEVRTIKLIFSNLTEAILNATLVYNPKGQPIEIHRGLLDPATMNLVDPAMCRFDGLINKAPFRRAKSGSDGQVVLECQSHARTLAKGNPVKLSDEFYKRRSSGDRFGRYLDVVPKIVWGQADVVHGDKKHRREKWIS